MLPALIAVVLLLAIAQQAWGTVLALAPWTGSHCVPEAGVTVIPLALLLSFAFVPSVSANIFAAWSCAPFRNVDSVAANAPEAPATIEYLRKDLSVVCHSSGEHLRIVAAATVLMGIWPIGVPVLYVLLLLRIRRPILAHTPSRLTRATAFLHRDYKPVFFYWEALEISRRILLTGWVALIPESLAFLRIVIGA